MKQCAIVLCLQNGYSGVFLGRTRALMDYLDFFFFHLPKLTQIAKTSQSVFLGACAGHGLS